MLNRANLLSDLGRHEEALAGYEEAGAVFVRYGREMDMAGCAIDRAGALHALGRHEEALAGYEEAGAAFARLGLEIEVAKCALDRAVVFTTLGRLEEALAGYKEAGAAFARFGLETDVAICTMNRAVALVAFGRLEEAVAGFGEARPVFARFEQLDALVRCLNGLADSHLALAEGPAALASYEDACEVLEQALTRVGSRDEDAAGLRGQLPDPFLPAVTLLLSDAAAATAEQRKSEAVALRERAFRLAERSRSAKLREELGRRLVAGLGLEAADPELVARWRALQGELAALDLRLRNEGRRGGGALEEHEAQRGGRGELLAELTALERELFAADPEAAGLLSARLPELEELRAELAEGEGFVAT